MARSRRCGTGDEDAAVGSEDSPELGVWLQGGDESVNAERDDACSYEGDASVLAYSLPHEPRAADFCDRGDGEETDGSDGVHGRSRYEPQKRLDLRLGLKPYARFMSNRNTISDAAARTGVTASALRFYENAGLITPGRSDSGYRIYDDRAIERLRFISRAKQLGLGLDQITELVTLWDGDQCAPVAGRLRDLVADKLAETQERVAELIAFAGDLQRFSTALVDDTSGPCGDSCACQGSSEAVGLALVRKPPPDRESPPIACTLQPSEMTGRMADWQALVARSESPPVAVAGGVTVRFPADPELAAAVGALAAAEQSCCSFFTFGVRMDHTGTELTVTAPAEAATLVGALFGVSA